MAQLPEERSEPGPGLLCFLLFVTALFGGKCSSVQEAASFSIGGNVMDVVSGAVSPGIVHVSEGRIRAIEPSAENFEHYLIPGFIDAHIHIESSMLTPAEFARVAVTHGTVATVSDPHEIANVMGLAGVDYMIEDARHSPFKFCFGAPSCVPATQFETAGATLDAADVENLLERPEIGYLSEVMNFPGVLQRDPQVMAKINAALRLGKPVDGHAPELRGEQARRYAEAGITTDHECFTLAEALDKIACGMKILIRQGSAAKNYQALEPLLSSHPEHCMFCSDDLHPDALELGHIDALVRRAVAAGIDPVVAIRCASLQPAQHYKLPTGLLQPGDPADFLEIDNLTDIRVLRTFLDGRLVADNGRSCIERVKSATLNHFGAEPITVEALRIRARARVVKVSVIEVQNRQLITQRRVEEMEPREGILESDTARDLLKIAVVNRYESSPPALGFVKNFELRRGAIASSVAHDSHNIVAVGADDVELCRAINLIIRHRGGVCAVHGQEERILPLPVAGLMSNADAAEVAAGYSAVERMARELGSTLDAPLMTLAFMALLVIPHLKLSDRGLFSTDPFGFTPLYEV